MAMIPVKIVTVVPPNGVNGGLIDRRVFRKSEMVIIDTRAKELNVNGGLVPMTQAEYDASQA